jgi:RimJ/RimL family protein N-acetyltransferase
MAVIEPKTVTLKNGKKACLRTPTVEDTEILLEYLKAIFVDDRFFLTTAEEAEEWHTPEKQQERIDGNYRDDNKLSVVTIADDRIVSLSHLGCGPKRRIQHVGTMGISILPEFRGMGLGTAIMEAMVDWAAAHPVIEKLALDVQADNKSAIALYKKLEFVEEGRKVKELKYADGTYSDMICMYRFVK